MARDLLQNPDIYDAQVKGRIKYDYEERSGAGAISLECMTSYWTSTGANALTLADGSEGQVKRVVHGVDGGTLVITPANLAGASPTSTSVTLTTAGDSVTFQFLKGQWWVIGFWSNLAITNGLAIA